MSCSRFPQTADLRGLLLGLFLLAFAGSLSAQVTLTRGTNFSVDVNGDGRLAIDLLGKVWRVPARGGAARMLANADGTARRPRWSPEGNRLVYQVRNAEQQRLALTDIETATTVLLGTGAHFDQHPDWHPDGERVVFSSDRRATGFDIWEIDIPTGLSWRLTDLPGDETEPAWSADGRDLVYIHYDAGTWSVVLRRHGQPARVLETATTRLSSPSWRPDGSLITFLRHAEAGFSIDMIILSDPVLVRPLVEAEDFFVAPVAWIDRQEFLYTAGGHIRRRLFNAWSSANLPFIATVEIPETRQVEPPKPRALPDRDAAGGRLVVRVGRVLDGVNPDYGPAADILIDGNTITAIEPVTARPGEIVVDLGDLTAIPGLIDARAALPANVRASLGPLLLSFGITTLAAEHPRAAELDELWSGKDMPGPRLLGKGWQLDLDSATSLVIDRDALPVSPLGVRYEDFMIDAGRAPATVVSELADSRTRGLAALLGSRQARLLAHYASAPRHSVGKPRLTDAATAVVLGSRGNGLPPGIAQHAELGALVEAGLEPRLALQSAGGGAAAALGLGQRLGRLGPGAAADIVIVDGDPLADVDAARRVVAVVRNGRFFSAIGLIERAEAAGVVE
jgi:hypothetical protein